MYIQKGTAIGRPESRGDAMYFMKERLLVGLKSRGDAIDSMNDVT